MALGTGQDFCTGHVDEESKLCLEENCHHYFNLHSNTLHSSACSCLRDLK